MQGSRRKLWAEIHSRNVNFRACKFETQWNSRELDENIYYFWRFCWVQLLSHRIHLHLRFRIQIWLIYITVIDSNVAFEINRGLWVLMKTSQIGDY